MGKNSAARPLALAAQIARQVGMVETWPNVQTIRLAIEAEALHSDVSIHQAAALIATAAMELTHLSGYSCPAEWQRRECARQNSIDRFWFEDARWRTKDSYFNLLIQIKPEAS